MSQFKFDHKHCERRLRRTAELDIIVRMPRDTQLDRACFANVNVFSATCSDRCGDGLLHGQLGFQPPCAPIAWTGMHARFTRARSAVSLNAPSPTDCRLRSSLLFRGSALVFGSYFIHPNHRHLFSNLITSIANGAFDGLPSLRTL